MSDSKEITRPVAFHDGEITVYADQIDLIRNVICKGATDEEMKLHFYNCARCGVHPLSRLVHFTVRTDARGARTYTPVISVDYMRMRAESSGVYAGSDASVFTEDTNVRGERDMICTVNVYKVVQGLRCPFAGVARWREFAKTGGADSFMWGRMPKHMLAKCAEAQALRKAFPGQLAGLYLPEEIGDDEPARELPAVTCDQTADIKADMEPEDDAAKERELNELLAREGNQ